MADDTDTQQDTGNPDLNDHYMRLVASVAQLVGGKPPAGTQAGNPGGTPGVPVGMAGGAPTMSMMPGMTPDAMQQPQAGGQPPAPLGGGQPQMPNIPPQGPLNQMGQPSPTGQPMPTALGMQSEYHTPTPPWQTPQPGGGQPMPQNPNPGQPYAAYKVGDQPWMQQPIQGGQPSGAPQPADMGAKPQPQSPMPTIQNQTGGLPEPPQVPPATTPQQAEKYLRQMYPGAQAQQYRQHIPQTIEYLNQQNKERYELESKGYKDALSNSKEMRLHQSTQARVDTTRAAAERADKRLDMAKTEAEKKEARADSKAKWDHYKLAVGIQANLLQGAQTPETRDLGDEMSDVQQDSSDTAPSTPSSDTGGEKPPMEGAKKAPDGKWYVQKGGKYYPVEE